jgi:hypothetical protein
MTLHVPQQTAGFIPMIYVDSPGALPRWDYHVLDFDPREAPPPGAPQLATLGAEGWLLVGILPQPMRVMYYFVRAAR